MFDLATKLERCKMRKSPEKPNIRNFFEDTACIDNAFKEIHAVLVEFKPLASLLLNATKYAPPSLESCLFLTNLFFTESLSQQSI